MIAIVVGATGLVGNQLVNLLLENDHFEKVLVFVRRKLDIKNIKLQVNVVDFDHPEDWGSLVIGDVLFLAMGTTMKKAGSKENQYRIDYLYQYQTAQIAVANGVGKCILVSSAGASENSSVFYSRMKGELERDMKELGFTQLVILQPSILDGDRKEKRTAEKISLNLMKLLKNIPGIKKYRPIHARIVALAMINSSLTTALSVETVTLDEIFDRAG